MYRYFTPSLLCLLVIGLLISPLGCKKEDFIEVTVKQPKGPLALALKQENEYALINQENTLYVEVDIIAQQLDKESRQPLNLSLVVDRSGSMLTGGKLDYVKQAAAYLIDKLTPQDSLSVVTYSTDVKVIFPQGEVKDKELLKDKLNFVAAKGWTNMSGGLSEGFEQVASRAGEGAINHIILLSDGLANRGISDEYGLRKLVFGFQEEEVTVSTIGVGLDYDEDIMRGISEEASGDYYYIAEPQEIPDIYASEFDRLANAVASDAGLIIRLQRGIDLLKVFGQQFREIDEGLYHVDLGKLQSGEERWVVMELDIAAREETGKMELGSVTLSYTDISREEGIEEEKLEESRGIYLTFTDSVEDVEQGRNINVFNTVNYMLAQETKQMAQRLLKRGDVSGAEELLASTSDEISLRYEERGISAPGAISSELGGLDSTAEMLGGGAGLTEDKLSELRKEMDYDAYKKTKYKENIK